MVSLYRNFMEINSHQHRLRDLPTLSVCRMNASFHRQHDPIDLAVVGDVVEPFGPAEDVHRVFQPAEETILREVGNLFLRVGGESVRKRDLQRAPAFSVLFPLLEFLQDIPRRRKLEGRGEIIPEGVAVKVGDMDVLPRCRLAKLRKRAR